MREVHICFAIVLLLDLGSATAGNNQTLAQQAWGWRMQNVQDKAYVLAQQAAAAGDPNGMALLADLYYEGAGGPRNHPEALKLYQQVFPMYREMGVPFPDARFATMCAYLHAEGEGVPRNVAEARRWFGKALELTKNLSNQNLQRLQPEAGLAALEAGKALPPLAARPHSVVWHAGIAASKQLQAQAPAAAQVFPSTPTISIGTTFNDGSLKDRGGGFTHLVEAYNPKDGRYTVLHRVAPRAANDCYSCVEVTTSILKQEDIERLPGRASDKALCPSCQGTNLVSVAKIDPKTGKQYYSSTSSIVQYNGTPGGPARAGLYGSKSYSPVFESRTCGLCKGKGEWIKE